MRVIRSLGEMAGTAIALRREGRTVALVPTMGALHRGHLSLLEIARGQADFRVMSIFVNPTQFGPTEDFKRYPRPFEDDCRKAEEAGCDVVFAPSEQEMYPPGHRTKVNVSGITGLLCGASRPGHFDGVTTVVLKFLNIVNPHFAVFGAKDAQQVVVIERMIADLNHPVRILVGPTVREADGLALSSRNEYLTPDERNSAPCIYRGLCAVRALFSSGERSSAALRSVLHEEIARSSLLEPEYCEIVDRSTLDPLETTDPGALVAVACRTKESRTRLIDNIILEVNS